MGFLASLLYRSSDPSLTDGEQVEPRCDALGRLRVAGVGERPFTPVKGSITHGQTSYTAAGLCVGGLITVATGLPSGTVLTSLSIRIKVLTANVSAAPTLGLLTFDANPTGSTFTDNAASALVAADLAKTIGQGNAGPASAITTTTGGLTVWNFLGIPIAAAGGQPRLAVDSSGNVYCALSTTGSVLTLGSTNVLFYEVDGLY